jgi:hypothetical protein
MRKKVVFGWKASTAFGSGPSLRQGREVLKKPGVRRKVVFRRCHLGRLGLKASRGPRERAAYAEKGRFSLEFFGRR